MYFRDDAVFFFFFLDLARLDPSLQNRGLVQFLACFLQNVLSFTYTNVLKIDPKCLEKHTKAHIPPTIQWIELKLENVKHISTGGNNLT
jgi:hypothetical protein